MAHFTTPIELHHASTSEDYNKLHEEMQKEGFNRTITSNTGVHYQLPTAEYDKIGEYTSRQVFDAGSLAASRTGKKFAILVTEANNRIWEGLPKA